MILWCEVFKVTNHCLSSWNRILCRFGLLWWPLGLNCFCFIFSLCVSWYSPRAGINRVHIMYGFPSLALRVPFCISYLQLLAVDGSNQTPRPFFFQLFTTIIGWYTPTSDSILYYAYLLLFVYLNVLVLDWFVLLFAARLKLKQKKKVKLDSITQFAINSFTDRHLSVSILVGYAGIFRWSLGLGMRWGHCKNQTTFNFKASTKLQLERFR